MAPQRPASDLRALVTVFDSVEAAQAAAESLRGNGFAFHQVELVNKDIRRASTEIGMPKIHQTTESVAEAGALKGAGIGVGVATGFGAAAVALTASPAIAIGAMIYAGFAGGLIGGIGGVDKADLDDTVNLPTLDEYQDLVERGNSLVIVCGVHDELVKAERVLKNSPHTGSHMHRLHGHLFHEHPSQPETRSSDQLGESGN